MNSFLPSAMILGAVAGLSLYLTLVRGWAEERPPQLAGAVRVSAALILLQAAHFGEELATGFEARFPALFGLPPIPLRLFVGFNLAWLAIWSVAALGLAGRRRAALFPLWFLGLAEVVNGAGHPALALAVGGYFPGLATAPAAGLLGLLLLRRLLAVTAPGRPRAG